MLATTINVSRDYSGSLAGFMNMAGNVGGVISLALSPWLAGRVRTLSAKKGEFEQRAASGFNRIGKPFHEFRWEGESLRPRNAIQRDHFPYVAGFMPRP